jgi:hypothetical protein
MSVVLIFVPAAINVCITSVQPCIAAVITGVRPSFVAAFTSALSLSKASTIKLRYAQWLIFHIRSESALSNEVSLSANYEATRSNDQGRLPSVRVNVGIGSTGEQKL